jgi:hypothetical protein
MKRIEIEGQGMFRVPDPVYDMVLEINARAEAAEAEVTRLRWLIANGYNAGVLTGAFMREALQVTEAELSGMTDKE